MTGSGIRRPLQVFVLSFLAAASAGLGTAQALHAIDVHRYDTVGPVCRVITNDRVVALSFDDGPDPSFTPRVLALLDRLGIKATFFVTGARVQASPALFAREIAAGMEIGNHTWSHPHLRKISPAATAGEVRRAAAELASAGATVRLFRPPYGEITSAELRVVRGLGLDPVRWSLAPDHYVGGLGLSAPDAGFALSRDVRPGDIILAHDVPGSRRDAAFDALSTLLAHLKDAGVRVTTVGELLRAGSGVRAKPGPWFWQPGLSCPKR